MSDRVVEFVRRWTSDHVHNQPGLDDYTEHVRDLADEMIAAAEKAGFDQDEVESAIGDVEEHLKDYYEQIQDSDAGFRDPD